MGRSKSHTLHQSSTTNSIQMKSRNNQAQQYVSKQPQQFKRSLQQLESINECQAKDQKKDIEKKSNDLDSYVDGNITQDAPAYARCSTKETTKALLNAINDDTTNKNNNFSNANNNDDQMLGEMERHNCCYRGQQLQGAYKLQNPKPKSNLLSSKSMNGLTTTRCCDVDVNITGAMIKDLCYRSDTDRYCPVAGEVTTSLIIGNTTVGSNNNNNDNKQLNNKLQIQQHQRQQPKKQQTRETAINRLSEFYEPHLVADDFNASLLLPQPQQNLSKFSIPINNNMDNSSNNKSDNRISRNSNRCADDSDDFVCCALSLITSSSQSLSSSSESSIIHTPVAARQIKSNNLDLIGGTTSNNKLQTARQQPLHDCRQFVGIDDDKNYDQLPENETTEQFGWISGIQAVSDVKTSELDYNNQTANKYNNKHHHYHPRQLPQQRQFSKLKCPSVNLSQSLNQTTSSSCCSCYSKNYNHQHHLSECFQCKSTNDRQSNGLVDEPPVKLTQVNGEPTICCTDKNCSYTTLFNSGNLTNTTRQPYANYLRKINNNNNNHNNDRNFDRNSSRIADQSHQQDSISKQKLNHNNNNKYQILVSSSTSELSSSASAYSTPVAEKSSILREQQNYLNKSSEIEEFYQTKNPLWNHLDWRSVAKRYREMPRQHRGQFCWRMRQSCLCHAFFSTIYTLFPILSSFKNYSFPGDLLTDLMAGFTIAILHIPQGMAYGMLSGVEPIYGLYVSFIPVLIMALMSKSLHVSYGTFAVVSMLLANSVESVKIALKQQHQQLLSSSGHAEQKSINSVIETSSSSPSSSIPPLNLPTPAPSISNIAFSTTLDGLVLTNNHQPSNPSQRILNNLLVSSTANLNINNQQQQQQQQQPLIGLNNNFSTLASTGDNGLWTFDIDGGEFLLPSSIEILTSICLLTGMIQIFMSLARLGVLSLMFSDQLVSGFTTASAINVVTSQIAAVFDLSLPIVPEGLFKMCRIWFAFGNKLTEGFNIYTTILSLISIIFLLSVKEIIEPILRKRHKSFTCLPTELVLMSVIIFSSWYWQFETNYDIKIVGTVPTGLPEPSVPRLDIAPLIYQDAITVALISFAMNLSLAQVYAKKFRYTLDPNQELFALGASNFVGSFFNCFPCASSLSRSAIQSNLNVKSQICSLFSCALVVSMICYFAPILHDLPRSTLSCIIIVALKGILIQIKDLYSNWRLSKLDALVWMVTFMSVIAFGITYGLILGIIASLFMVFFRLLTPNHSILGQLPGTDIYVDTTAFVDSKEIDNVKIFRFNSALCYLNRTMFKSYIEKSLPSMDKKQLGFRLFCSRKKQTQNDDKKIKYLIIDCSALAYCDYSGAATLVDIVEELGEHKISVYLASCALKLIHMIERMQKNLVLERNIYPTITDAINYIRYLKNRASQTHSAMMSDCTATDNCSFIQSVTSCLP